MENGRELFDHIDGHIYELLEKSSEGRDMLAFYNLDDGQVYHHKAGFDQPFIAGLRARGPGSRPAPVGPLNS